MSALCCGLGLSKDSPSATRFNVFGLTQSIVSKADLQASDDVIAVVPLGRPFVCPFERSCVDSVDCWNALFFQPFAQRRCSKEVRVIFAGVGRSYEAGNVYLGGFEVCRQVFEEVVHRLSRRYAIVSYEGKGDD
jgi:hypothetical protein